MTALRSAVLIALLSPFVPGAAAGARPGDTDPGPGPAHRAEAPLAIVGATLIDGRGGPPLRNVTIVIEKDRIVRIGEALAPPEGATVIDARGRSVLPGYIDTHGHPYSADAKNQFEAFPRLYLAGGVTTVFSPGDADPDGTLALVRRLDAGEEPGPRLLMGGPYYDGVPSTLPWIKGTETPEAAVALFEKWRPHVVSIKLQMRLGEAQAKALIDAAHRAGITVTGHLDSLSATRAIELGIDRLEHGIYAMSELAPLPNFSPAAFQRQTKMLAELDLESEAVTKLIDLIGSKRTVLSPTCASFESRLPEWEPVAPDWERFFEPEVAARHRAALGRQKAMPEERAALVRAGLKNQLRFLKLVKDRGGRVVTGTDPGAKIVVPGYGLHREMKLLVDAGFSPSEAIVAATLEAARALGKEKDRGSIEPGKLADLVIVDGNPLDDIRAAGRVTLVVRGGVRFEPEVLRKAAEGKIH